MIIANNNMCFLSMLQQLFTFLFGIFFIQYLANQWIDPLFTVVILSYTIFGINMIKSKQRNTLPYRTNATMFHANTFTNEPDQCKMRYSKSKFYCTLCSQNNHLCRNETHCPNCNLDHICNNETYLFDEYE